MPEPLNLPRRKVTDHGVIPKECSSKGFFENINTTKMEKNIEQFVPAYDTHNLFCEGYGRKIHVLNNYSGKCLCGYESGMLNEVSLDGNPYNDIVEWITQPDPDKNICQRCKSILLSKLPEL